MYLFIYRAGCKGISINAKDDISMQYRIIIRYKICAFKFIPKLMFSKQCLRVKAAYASKLCKLHFI